MVAERPTLQKQNQKVIKDDKVLQSADENLAELTASATRLRTSNCRCCWRYRWFEGCLKWPPSLH